MTPTKLELLAIQSAIVHDRVPGRYGLTVALTETDRALWIGDAVPDAPAREMSALFASTPAPRIPNEPPPILAELARLLDERDPLHPVLERRTGPTYRIDPDTPLSVGVHLETNPDKLREANPGHWEPVEWTELLDGTLGPYAIATVGGRVASICHTPGPLTPTCAEVGVWTHTDYRGRGYAAATTAAWTRLVRAPGRYLFYSTDSANHSSQRVASRLRLQLLGWTYRLAPPRASSMHPLCSVAR